MKRNSINRDDLTPRCEDDADVETNAAVAQMRREFIAAYRDINQCASELRRVRRGAKISAKRERAALQAVERAILARDALENKYARLGLSATPVVKDGLVRTIHFSKPRPREEQPSVISMCFAVMPPSYYETNSHEKRAELP
jgi:hypothetical protein